MVRLYSIATVCFVVIALGKGYGQRLTYKVSDTLKNRYLYTQWGDTAKQNLSNMLNEVRVFAKRSANQDSVNTRKWFKKEFDYKGPTLSNVFVKHNATSSSELITIDPMMIIALITKKSSRQSKLQQVLLRDENAEFIDRKFSEGLVASVTGLKADSLSAFMITYRPDINFCRNTSAYGMINYIKNNLANFRKKSNALSVLLPGNLFK